MKKPLFLIIILIILIPCTYADKQLSVEFHSYGKDAVIDLNEFLGEGYYTYNASNNVRVVIDQVQGLAKIYAKPGWLGSEIIVFSITGEKPREIEDIYIDTSEPTKGILEIETPSIDETDTINLIVEDNIAEDLKNRVREIRQEKIKKIESKVEESTVSLTLNEEVNFQINFEEDKPKLNMEFVTSKDEKRTVITPEIKEELDLSWILVPAILIILLLSIAFTISKKEKITRSFGKITFKRNALKRLRKLNYNAEDSKTYWQIMERFFGDYFGLGSGLDFKELKKKIKHSNLSFKTKLKFINFINDLVEIDPNKIMPPEKLKDLIKKTKKLIKAL